MHRAVSGVLREAYGRFMHHHPVGGAPADIEAAADPMDEQLRRTVIAWELVAMPGEPCVLWDLDNRVGVKQLGASISPGSRRYRPPSTKLRPSVRN